MKGWGLGWGLVLMEPPPSLLAVVNSSGGAGSGLAFGGTMGSNALSFYSGGGPGVLKAYSIGTTSANRRSTRN